MCSDAKEPPTLLYDRPQHNAQEVDGLDRTGGGEQGEGEENAFRREFQRLDAGNGVVHVRDMPRLIQGALGRDVRPWIRDRILKMFEANRCNIFWFSPAGRLILSNKL